MKTVKDMKCGFCGIQGHTARTCEEKKKHKIKEERKARRKQAKKYYYSDSKSLSTLTDKLTEEGKIALLNNGFMRSPHFVVQTKPETAIQELLVEPMIEKISTRAKGEGRQISFSREPHFKTLDNKNKYLDYLLTVSFKGHKAPTKWLIEAEAPNQTHKGIEQIEDFLASVPNVNEYRFVVTDGYWYHFCHPTIDSALEWTSLTIDDSSFWVDNKIEAMFLDITPVQNMKKLGLVCGILGVMLAWTYLM